MSNPLLSERFFGQTNQGAVGHGSPGWGSAQPGQAPPPVPPGYDAGERSPWQGPGATRTMTYGGVTSATGALLLLVIVGGIFGWTQVTETSLGIDQTGKEVFSTNLPAGLFFGSMILGFVLAIGASFKPNLARFLAPAYALVQGVFVGMISRMYDARFDGIVVQAVLATVAVFAVMLVLYGMRILRATPRFTKGVIAATFGIMAVYMVGFIASLFGANMRFWNEPSPLGIGISIVIVIVASLNLILDFDFIEKGVKNGLPKQMEWFAAFGLVVTLVWLYLEMLRLLSLLQQR